ncbi:DUF5402 family protein [Methanothermococcus okinawensis]|uniref:Uncharacterized protein n=1 Tax=Methanothermococcus okinawensis (strain DSM 14208 / JCM 11175 / IH1) TaxID=647113 RepID=F8AM93_METOI|nr:DUF5402 family protein [Methanothermococcus okinawensis]AEH06783.1 hypothetical protein Metok_0806 [Methanothermococcus okinawensis IH1]
MSESINNENNNISNKNSNKINKSRNNMGNNKPIKELIKNDRRYFEEFLSNSFGKNIFVPEMDVFSSKCGCYGIMIMTRGVLFDEVDVFKDRIIKKLEEIANNYGINANWIFIRIIPSSEDVISFGVRELCNMCREEYNANKPRPDLITLKYD